MSGPHARRTVIAVRSRNIETYINLDILPEEATGKWSSGFSCGGTALKVRSSNELHAARRNSSSLSHSCCGHCQVRNDDK